MGRLFTSGCRLAKRMSLQTREWLYLHEDAAAECRLTKDHHLDDYPMQDELTYFYPCHYSRTVEVLSQTTRAFQGS